MRLEAASLRADCSRCIGLCCVGLAFRASRDFAADKAPGTPCPNLASDDRCSIHTELRPAGYGGCIAFDCFGAGQQLAQETFAGRHWREGPSLAASMFAVLDVLRRIRELLFHTLGALDSGPGEELSAELLAAGTTLEELLELGASDLERLDVFALQAPLIRLLERAAADARGRVSDPCGLDLAAADLQSVDLSGATLRGANLRHARLAGANLAGADLAAADLFGTDLHDADVRGAQLADALFLTQLQVEVATGDVATTLPESLRRPEHWEAPDPPG